MNIFRKNSSYGFTLIELLITITIMLFFFFMAIAAYNNFNRSQILTNAVKDFRGILRQAQNSAISGSKDISRCAGKVLSFWMVSWDTNSYTISGNCEGVSFKQNTYNLSNGISVLASGSVYFYPVAKGASQAEVCIRNDKDSYKIIISSGGEITETKYANSTNCS